MAKAKNITNVLLITGAVIALGTAACNENGRPYRRFPAAAMHTIDTIGVQTTNNTQNQMRRPPARAVPNANPYYNPYNSGYGRGFSMYDHPYSPAAPTVLAKPEIRPKDSSIGPNTMDKLSVGAKYKCKRNEEDTDNDGICDAYENKKSEIFPALSSEIFNGLNSIAIEIDGSCEDIKKMITDNDQRAIQKQVADALKENTGIYMPSVVEKDDSGWLPLLDINHPIKVHLRSKCNIGVDEDSRRCKGYGVSGYEEPTGEPEEGTCQIIVYQGWFMFPQDTVSARLRIEYSDPGNNHRNGVAVFVGDKKIMQGGPERKKVMWHELYTGSSSKGSGKIKNKDIKENTYKKLTVVVWRENTVNSANSEFGKWTQGILRNDEFTLDISRVSLKYEDNQGTYPLYFFTVPMSELITADECGNDYFDNPYQYALANLAHRTELKKDEITTIAQCDEKMKIENRAKELAEKLGKMCTGNFTIKEDTTAKNAVIDALEACKNSKKIEENQRNIITNLLNNLLIETNEPISIDSILKDLADVISSLKNNT